MAGRQLPGLPMAHRRLEQQRIPARHRRLARVRARTNRGNRSEMGIRLWQGLAGTDRSARPSNPRPPRRRRTSVPDSGRSSPLARALTSPLATRSPSRSEQSGPTSQWKPRPAHRCRPRRTERTGCRFRPQLPSSPRRSRRNPSRATRRGDCFNILNPDGTCPMECGT